MIAATCWIGSVLCVWSLVRENQARFRALNLGALCGPHRLNIANAAWSGVPCDTVVAAINVRQLIATRSASSAPVRVPAADRRRVEHIEHRFASVCVDRAAPGHRQPLRCRKWTACTTSADFKALDQW